VRRQIKLGLAVAILVNLLLIGAWVWSRDGQTTVVAVESNGGAYRALVDGRQAAPNSNGPVPLDAPASGTIVLTLPPPAPSLPSPSGVGSIRVTASDGAVLFEDGFSELDTSAWEVVSGRFVIEDGVLVAKDTAAANSVVLRDGDFADATVSVTFRNGVSGLVGTHIVEGGGVFYHFNLVRDFPNFLDASNNGQGTARVFGGFVHTEKQESIASIAAMVTRPYPYIVAGLALAVVATMLLSPAERLLARGVDSLEWGRARRWLRPGIAVGVIAALACAVTLAINGRYYAFLPHVPDEVGYLFQAKLLASGQVTGAIPPVKEAFYFYSPSFLYENGDRWASFYPFGHPIVLAIGVPFGVVWLIPSLVGAACVGLTYLVGKKLYGGWTGLIAAGLLAASPFFLMQASSFMSHNTGVLYILLSLLFIVKRERPLLYGAIAGIAFGLGVNTRPLTMIALTLPFGVLLLSYLLPRVERRDAIIHTAAFGVAAAVVASGFLLYNYGLTGDPLTTPYAGQDGDTSTLFGFTNGHTLDIGLRNEQAQMMSLLLTLNGWPAFVGLGFMLLPFALGSRNRWDYFSLACVVAITGFYVFYRYSGVYLGPRYWYEAAPFMLLLAARGAESAAGFVTAAALSLRRRLRLANRPLRWTGGAVVYTVLAGFVVYGSAGWLLGWLPAWNTPLVPGQASAMDGVFDIDNRLDKLADQTDLENALVLVKPCGFFGSRHCYGSVFLRNSIDFDGDVVWARYDQALNDQTIAAFPGRTVYVATWDGGAKIEPYDPSVD
jgi:4-amino-4-deoxy-L-arabinose transferase-like glycosyltransferase